MDWLAPRRPDPRGEDYSPPAFETYPSGSPAYRLPAPARTRPASRRSGRSRPAFRLGGSAVRNAGLALGLALSVVAGSAGSIAYSALTAGDHASPSRAAVLTSPTASRSPSSTRATSSSSSAAAPNGGEVVTPLPNSSGPILSTSVTFSALALDPATEAAGTARTFSFTSDGPGSVSVQVATSPAAGAKLCLQANEAAPNCQTSSAPSVSAVAPAGEHTRWLASVAGTGPDSVSAVVSLGWQTRSPAITLRHGRFQGVPKPDLLRGFRVSFKTHSGGPLTITASWPPIMADATLTLRDVTASPGTALDQAQYMGVAGIATAYSHPLESGRSYEVILLNDDQDTGRPDLRVTIAFP